MTFIFFLYDLPVLIYYIEGKIHIWSLSASVPIKLSNIRNIINITYDNIHVSAAIACYDSGMEKYGLNLNTHLNGLKKSDFS